MAFVDVEYGIGGAQSSQGEVSATTSIVTVNCGFRPSYIAVFFLHTSVGACIGEYDNGNSLITWKSGGNSFWRASDTSVFTITDNGFTYTRNSDIADGKAHYIAIE